MNIYPVVNEQLNSKTFKIANIISFKYYIVITTNYIFNNNTKKFNYN